MPLFSLHFAILCGTASAIFVLNCIYLFPEWVAYLLSHSMYTFLFIQLVHISNYNALPEAFIVFLQTCK